MVSTQEFEPVYLVPEGPLQPTDDGKRWVDKTLTIISKFSDTLKDIGRAAKIDMQDWDPRLNVLRGAGIPMMVSGISQATMQKTLDYLDGLTTTAFSPTGNTVYLALSNAAVTYASTGVTLGDGTSNYTGYGRFTALSATYFNAATAAGPSVVSTKAQIQFAACSGGGSVTENSVAVCDVTTLNTGVIFFFGTITPVVISPTQTPPTIASGALTIQIAST